MGNKNLSLKTPVSNPGRSGVFLFPNASTFNVPAFNPFPLSPGGRLYVGHVFPFPLSLTAVASLPDPFPSVRGRPLNPARKLSAKKTGVDVVEQRPFRPHGGRPKTSAVPVRPFPFPLPDVGHGGRPIPFPTVDPDGRPRQPRRSTSANPWPDDPGRRSRRSTTVDDPGRRPVGRNGNGGLRI